MFLRYASFWGRKFILPRKCRENATKMPQKKSASADLSVILIYSLFLFMHQKEQVTSPQACIFSGSPIY